MQALDGFFLPRLSMNSAPVVTSQCAVTKKAPVWGMTPPHGHHGHATVAGEHGRTGSAPSSMNHSTSVPKLMQSTTSVGDGGEDTSRHATAVAGRWMSEEAVQALVCGAQCLREGLMSYIYRSRWSRAPFLGRYLGSPMGRSFKVHSATEELFWVFV
jgi:hypothetical protein